MATAGHAIDPFRLGLSQSRISVPELDPSSIALDQLLRLCSTRHLELVVQAKAAPTPAQSAAFPAEW